MTAHLIQGRAVCITSNERPTGRVRLLDSCISGTVSRERPEHLTRRMFSSASAPGASGSALAFAQVDGVPGLYLARDFVARSEEHALLAAIDSSKWSDALRRRVQHYGYRYDYRLRTIDETHALGPLPEWSAPVVERLTRVLNAPDAPWAACSAGASAGASAYPASDQIIVNEYKPGQGIGAHTDCVPCFGPAVASLSLGSQVIMDFSCGYGTSARTVPVLLPERSLVLLTGDARYRWRHAIAPRMLDVIDGIDVPRTRRVSLTLRTVLLSPRAAMGAAAAAAVPVETDLAAAYAKAEAASAGMGTSMLESAAAMSRVVEQAGLANTAAGDGMRHIQGVIYNLAAASTRGKRAAEDEPEGEPSAKRRA